MNIAHSSLRWLAAAALVAGLAGIAAAEEEAAPQREISLRRGEEKPRRYDNSIQMNDSMMHMSRPNKRKTERYEAEDIPEARQKDFRFLPDDPTPHEYIPPKDTHEIKPDRKKNWILPPKPDYESDSSDLMRGAKRDDEPARRSILDSIYSDAKKNRGPSGNPDDDKNATYDSRGNRIREASKNLLYTEEDEFGMRLGKKEEKPETMPTSYQPVVSDRVGPVRGTQASRSSPENGLNEKDLENLSVADLEKLARERESEIQTRQDLGDVQVVRGVTRFTQGAGTAESGMWQTQRLLAGVNTGGLKDTSEEEGSRQPVRAEAAVVSEQGWKDTFTTLSATLDSSPTYREGAAQSWRPSGVNSGIRTLESTPSGLEATALPSTGSLRNQLDIGGVQPTADFSGSGSTGFGSIGGAVSATSEISSRFGETFSSTASPALGPEPTRTLNSGKGGDLKNLSILMN